MGSEGVMLAPDTATVCAEGVVCRGGPCEDALARVGHVRSPEASEIWCRPPGSTLGSSTPVVGITLAFAAIALAAVAFTRERFRPEGLTRGDRFRAAGLALLALGVGLLRPGGRTLQALLANGLDFSTIAAATLIGLALVVRVGPSALPRAFAAAAVPVLTGVAFAERNRVLSLRSLEWSWAVLDEATRARILADVVEIGARSVSFGLAGAGAILAFAAARSVAPPVAWRKAGIFALLAVVARVVAWKAPVAPCQYLAFGFVIALAVVARGGVWPLLVGAAVAVDLAGTVGGMRDALDTLGREGMWPSRFAIADAAGSLLIGLPLMLGADAALAFAVGRPAEAGRRESARGLVVLVCALLAFGATWRNRAMFEASLASAERLVRVADEVGAPVFEGVPDAALSPPLVALRSGEWQMSYVDEGTRWQPLAPRPAPLRALRFSLAVPASLRVDEAARATTAFTGRGRIADVLVRVHDPPSRGFVRALVGPPVRTVPLAFDPDPLAPDDRPFERRPRLEVRPRGASVLVGAREVPRADAPRAIKDACPRTTGASGLLVLSIEPTRTIDEALRLVAELVPSLEFQDRDYGPECHFGGVVLTL